MDPTRPAVVKVWEGNLVLGANLVSNDDLIDIVELVPVFIAILTVYVTIEGLEFRTTRDSQVEGLGSVKRLLIEEIKVVFVSQVRKKLICQTIEVGHDGKRQAPATIGRAIDHFGVLERLMVIEPVEHWVIFIFVEFKLDWLQWLHI